MAAEGLAALAEVILGEARERAGRIIREAEERAGTVRRDAHAAAEAERQRLTAEDERDAERFRARSESAARLEARRRILAEREALIARALAMAHERLVSGLTPQEREAALGKSLHEAATALEGGRLTVLTNGQDAELLTPGFLGEVQARLAAAGVRSEFVPGQPVEIGGGAVVVKDEGRVVFDSSFEARLERLRWSLRNEIWRVLEGAAEAERIPM